MFMACSVTGVFPNVLLKILLCLCSSGPSDGWKSEGISSSGVIAVVG